jgi:hypothetical protein
MIAGQQSQQDRAFNRSSFQKCGGVEGLLERFLNRALEARETEARQQAAIKVLLALADLDRDARAALMTLEALTEKIGGTVSGEDTRESLMWLARSDVRLVNSTDEYYELAHERLIPALRRIAGKQLSAADQASQLLDRRVNEWLGNNRARRYLLKWRELRLIERQRPYIVWGANRTHKDALLVSTKRRRRTITAYFCGSLLLVMAIALTYVIWRNTEAGQRVRIEGDLLALSSGIDDPPTLSAIADALVMSGSSARALQLAESKDSESRAHIMETVAGTLARESKRTKSPQLLVAAERITEQIDRPRHKVSALCTIAEDISKEDPEEAQRLLETARQEASQEDDPARQAATLTNLTLAMARVATSTGLVVLMERAQQIAETIKETGYHACALAGLGEFMSTTKMASSRIAFQRAEMFAGEEMDDNIRTLAWTVIAGAIARAAVASRSEELLKDAIDIGKELNLSYGWMPIRDALARLELDSQLFDRAVEFAGAAENEDERAHTLFRISSAAADLAATTHSTELADRAELLADQIDPAVYKAAALCNVARGRAKIDIDKSLQCLQKAQECVKNVAANRKDQVWAWIVHAMATVATAAPVQRSAAIPIQIRYIAADAAWVPHPSQRRLGHARRVNARMRRHSRYRLPQTRINGRSDELFARAKQIIAAEIIDAQWKSVAKSNIVEEIARAARNRSSEIDPPPVVALLREAERLASGGYDALCALARATAMATRAFRLPAEEGGRALRQLEQARRLASSEDDAETLEDLAGDTAAVAVALNSRDLFEQATRDVDRLSEPTYKAIVLSEVASATADAGSSDTIKIGDGDDLLRVADTHAQQVSRPFEKAAVLAMIADGMATIDEGRSAKRYSDQAAHSLIVAQDLVNGTDDPDVKDTALEVVVEAMACVACRDASTSVWQRAQPVAQVIRNSVKKTRAWVAIAEEVAKIDPAQSQHLFETARELAMSEAYTNDKSAAIGAIASALARVAMRTGSPTMLRQAYDATKEIEDPQSKADALGYVAVAAVRLGNPKLARKAGFDNQNNDSRAQVLALVLRTMSETGRPVSPEAAGPVERRYAWCLFD